MRYYFLLTIPMILLFAASAHAATIGGIAVAAPIGAAATPIAPAPIAPPATVTPIIPPAAPVQNNNNNNNNNETNDDISDTGPAPVDDRRWNNDNENANERDTRPAPENIHERRRRDLEITRADRLIYGEQTVLGASSPAAPDASQQSVQQRWRVVPPEPTCPPGKTCTCNMGSYRLEFCDSPANSAYTITANGANVCVQHAPPGTIFNCAGQLTNGTSTMCNDNYDAAPFIVACGTLRPNTP